MTKEYQRKIYSCFDVNLDWTSRAIKVSSSLRLCLERGNDCEVAHRGKPGTLRALYRSLTAGCRCSLFEWSGARNGLSIIILKLYGCLILADAMEGGGGGGGREGGPFLRASRKRVQESVEPPSQGNVCCVFAF